MKIFIPYFVVVATYRREICLDDILGASISHRVEDRKVFMTYDEAQRYMDARFYDDCDYDIFLVEENEVTCPRAPQRRYYKSADKWYHEYSAINATDVYDMEGHYIETI